MLIADQATHDGDILHQEVEGHGDEGASDAKAHPEPAEAVDAERLNDAEDIHVEIDASDECGDDIHGEGHGHGEDGAQDDRGQGERHRHPRVERDR